MESRLKSGLVRIEKRESDMDIEEGDSIPEIMSNIYKALPDDSVVIIISRRAVDISEEQEEINQSSIEKVEISVVDNLTKEALEGPVFYLTHGLLDIIENSFDDVVEMGFCRAMHLLSIEEAEKGSDSENVINFANYKNIKGIKE